MIKARIVFYGLILIGIAAATTFIYHNTQQADMNYYRGHRLFEKGEYDEAIKFYKKTLILAPSYIEALEDLAYSHQWTKRHKEAINAFQKALLLNPEDNKLKKSLAETYIWNGQYDKAKDILKNILADNPGDSRAKLLFAKALHYSGEATKAIGIYKELLREKKEKKSE